jgi:hypothetical protein
MEGKLMKKSTSKKLSKIAINEGPFLALISIMFQIHGIKIMLERIKAHYLSNKENEIVTNEINNGHNPARVLNLISLFNNLSATSTYLTLYMSHGALATERYNIQELAFLRTTEHLKDLMNKLTLRILMITFLSYIVPVALTIFSIKYGLIGIITLLIILIITIIYISIDTKKMIILMRDSNE